MRSRSNCCRVVKDAASTSLRKMRTNSSRSPAKSQLGPACPVGFGVDSETGEESGVVMRLVGDSVPLALLRFANQSA